MSYSKWFALAAVGMAASQANAVTVYGYDNLASGSNNLISFDSATPGTVSVIGSDGQAGVLMSGLDFDGAGNLYSYGFNPSTSTNTGFYSVDKTTGAATLLGSSGINQGETVNDLAWNPVTGQMMAVAANAGATATSLYTINTATGAATFIGQVTGLGASNLIVGMAVNASGQVFLHDIVSDQMYSLSGLAATGMGAEGIATNFSQGMTIDWSGDNTWYHAAVLNSPSTAVNFYTVNATGQATLVGQIGPTALSFEPGDIAIAPVPEPASMVVLGLGVLAALRRRNRKV